MGSNKPIKTIFMETIYLVFEGNAWLDRNSLTLMGVYGDIESSISDILDEMSDNGMLDGYSTRDSVAKELSIEHQTFGFDTNYIIKPARLNEWGEI